MAQISKISLGETQYGLRASGIPFGKVDSTSTSTEFTATIPEITALEDGACMFLMNGVVTSAAGFTLDINSLGAKPCYSSMAAATRATTVFNKNYTMLFIYDSTRVSGGCWDIYYGYANSMAYELREYQANKKMASKLYRYQFCFTKRDGTLMPSNNTSNSTSTSKTLSTDAFDPTRAIYYYTYTTTINVGASPSASYLYTQYGTANMRYAFNVSTTSLTVNEPVYIRCTPQTDGQLKFDGNNCIVQALPITNDGKVYLLLGQSYSAYQIVLVPWHPCFKYDSRINAVAPWYGADYARESELSSYAPLSSPAFTGTPTIGGYNVLTTQDLTKVMHFRGVSSTAITNGGTETATIGGNQLTAEEGDVVIYNNVEYIWNGSAWEQMGDEYKLPIVIDINENDSIITMDNIKGYANNSGYTCTFLAQAFNKVPIYINFINTQNVKQIIRLQEYIPNLTLGTYTGDLYIGFYDINGNLKEFDFIILNDNSILGTSINDNLMIYYATTAGNASTADYATTAGSADTAINATYATNADNTNYATNADHAGSATTADTADYANSAASASSADITTTENAIAKYSDASGTFANSWSYN